MMDVSWLGPCWTGINCGDAGGWLSGLGSFAVIVFSLWQLNRGEKQKRAADSSHKAKVAIALSQDVIAIGISFCEAMRTFVANIDPTTKGQIKQPVFGFEEKVSSSKANVFALNDFTIGMINQLVVTVQTQRNHADYINTNKAHSWTNEFAAQTLSTYVGVLNVTKNVCISLITNLESAHDPMVDLLATTANDCTEQSKAGAALIRLLSPNSNFAAVAEAAGETPAA